MEQLITALMVTFSGNTVTGDVSITVTFDTGFYDAYGYFRDGQDVYLSVDPRTNQIIFGGSSLPAAFVVLELNNGPCQGTITVQPPISEPIYFQQSIRLMGASYVLPANQSSGSFDFIAIGGVEGSDEAQSKEELLKGRDMDFSQLQK